MHNYSLKKIEESEISVFFMLFVISVGRLRTVIMVAVYLSQNVSFHE